MRPGILLSASQCWDHKCKPPHLAFYVPCWRLNSGPYACTAGVLLREPLTQHPTNYILLVVQLTASRNWKILLIFGFALGNRDSTQEELHISQTSAQEQSKGFRSKSSLWILFFLFLPDDLWWVCICCFSLKYVFPFFLYLTIEFWEGNSSDKSPVALWQLGAEKVASWYLGELQRVGEYHLCNYQGWRGISNGFVSVDSKGRISRVIVSGTVCYGNSGNVCQISFWKGDITEWISSCDRRQEHSCK